MSSNAKALILMIVIVLLWAIFSHNANKWSGEKCDSCSVPIISHSQKHNTEMPAKNVKQK